MTVLVVVVLYHGYKADLQIDFILSTGHCLVTVKQIRSPSPPSFSLDHFQLSGMSGPQTWSTGAQAGSMKRQVSSLVPSVRRQAGTEFRSYANPTLLLLVTHCSSLKLGLNGNEANWPTDSQLVSGGIHRKQLIASVSHQGEDSPQIRTTAYRHESVGFTVQSRDEEDRVSRRARITECLQLVEQMVPSGPQADVHNKTKK